MNCYRLRGLTTTDAPTQGVDKQGPRSVRGDVQGGGGRRHLLITGEAPTPIGARSRRIQLVMRRRFANAYLTPSLLQEQPPDHYLWPRADMTSFFLFLPEFFAVFVVSEINFKCYRINRPSWITGLHFVFFFFLLQHLGSNFNQDERYTPRRRRSSSSIPLPTPGLNCNSSSVTAAHLGAALLLLLLFPGSALGLICSSSDCRTPGRCDSSSSASSFSWIIT